MIKEFLYKLVSNESEVSSRRFIVLIIAFNFTTLCFWLPVLLYFFIIRDRNAIVINRSFDLLEKLTDYQFWLICVGFGFITTSAFAAILGISAKAKVIRAEQGTPDAIVTQSVETQHVSGTALVDSTATTNEQPATAGEGDKDKNKNNEASMPEF